jgi:predicted lysophospholipase L1 biosynthesis ABC-type transport system permease subunit
VRTRFLYTVALGGSLIAFCWLGNALGPSDHAVHVYPWFLSVVPLPVILLLALRHHQRSHHPRSTMDELWREGRAVVWPASALFAVFVGVLAVYTWGHAPAMLLAATVLVSFLVTAALGSLFVWLLSTYLSRRADLRPGPVGSGPQ